MNRKRLFLLAAAVLTVVAATPLEASATPPAGVVMTIVETFNPTIGTFTATGGLFGPGTTGTSSGEYFKLDSFSLSSHDHFVVFSAANLITTAAGSFSIVFEASCQLQTFDPATGDGTAVCAGNWQVNGGTGAYSTLEGTLLVDADGNSTLEAENTVLSGNDCTGHAETNLMRMASREFSPAFRQGCTIYTSSEPCAMCAGAIYWTNVRRVVFALSQLDLSALTGSDPDSLVLPIPCREVFARGQHDIDVVGPDLVHEALAVHEGFWEAAFI